MKYKLTIELELSEDLLRLNEFMKDNPEYFDKLSALKFMLSKHYFSFFDIYGRDFDDIILKSLVEKD